jgi:hypothetical protein
MGRLPLDEERAIVELKARRLLGDVDVYRCPREYARACTHLHPFSAKTGIQGPQAFCRVAPGSPLSCGDDE